MSPRENVRSNMVDGAVILLATQGVEGTSFKEVLDVANAPRGSVYHHFPGGKSELLHAALDRASERALEAMEATRGKPASDVLDRFLALWQALLDYSQLRAGGAVVFCHRGRTRGRHPRTRRLHLPHLDRHSSPNCSSSAACRLTLRIASPL